MTRSTTLAVLALAAFALAGCSKTGGTATTNTTSTGSPSGSAAGGPSLANLDPCTLLTSGSLAQLGLPAGQKEDVGGQRGCVWNVMRDTPYSIRVGIRETQGLGEINSQGGQLSTKPVGKHDARLLQQPRNSVGGCMVIIGVTSSSRVDIDVRADTTAAACQFATQVASNVEPNLPS